MSEIEVGLVALVVGVLSAFVTPKRWPESRRRLVAIFIIAAAATTMWHTVRQ